MEEPFIVRRHIIIVLPTSGSAPSAHKLYSPVGYSGVVMLALKVVPSMTGSESTMKAPLFIVSS